MRLGTAPDFRAQLATVPIGTAGNEHTITMMRRMVRAARVDPLILNTANNIIHMVPAKDELAEVSALFDFILNHIRYTRDVLGIETLTDPRMTLQRLVGDCDDKATLLATLLESVGYPTRFVMADYTGQGFEHVYLQTWAFGEWLNLDPTEHERMGWAPPGVVNLWIERI